MSPTRRALLAQALALLLAGAWALALNFDLGQAGEPPAAPAGLARDPSGRRLYILVLDAMRADEIDRLPILAGLAQQGLVAEVEPCLDLFTTACVKQALTGRPTFDLFAPFEDFGVSRPRVGPNLLRDARAAGAHVEMLSTGHLGAFRKDVDADPRVEEPWSPGEVDLALTVAARSDLVLHHWVWHDIASHHVTRDDAAHAAALANVDAAIGHLQQNLPVGMDLLVMGDHGHLPDGRHLQGMELPTRLVLLSPHVVPGLVPGRLPIAVVRFLGSAVMGLLGPQVPVDRSWSSLLSPAVAWEEGAPLLAEDGGGPGLALGAVLVGIGLLSVVAAGKRGLVAVGWGAVLGLAFTPWMQAFDQQKALRPGDYFWYLPIGLALGLGLGKRALRAASTGGLLGAMILLLGLFPGMRAWGTARNIDWVVIPALAAAGLSALGDTDLRDRSSWPRRVGLLLGLGLLMMAVDELAFLQGSFAKIKHYPWADWGKERPWEADLAAGLLAGLAHLAAEGPVAWVLLSLLGAALGRQLPPEGHLFTVGLLAGATLLARGEARTRWMIVGAAAASAWLYPGVQRVGLWMVVAVAGLGLRALRQTAAPPAAAGLLAAAGAYLGLAWTCGLSTSGINYSFALYWTEGPWHERLWWLLGGATALQMFVPVLLIAELLRASQGAAALPGARLVARLAALRFTVLLSLCTVYVYVAAGQIAATRLTTVLQDALGWLLLGVVFLLSFLRGARAPA